SFIMSCLCPMRALLPSHVLRHPSRSTIFPYTTLFRSARVPQDYVHHLLLIADSGSELSYLENTGTIGTKAGPANIIEEVIAEPDSHIKFASVDRLGENTTAYLNRRGRSEEHTSELQSRFDLVCRLL